MVKQLTEGDDTIFVHEGECRDSGYASWEGTHLGGAAQDTFPYIRSLL